MLSVANLSVEALSRGSRPRPVLIDVRTEAETRGGIIPGARCLPLHLLPNELDRLRALVGDHRELVVYCQSGARSAQACRFLQSQGIERCSNLEGGVMAWLQSGRRLSADTEQASLVAEGGT